MSLLDFKPPELNTPEGQGLMAAAMSLLQARRRPGERGIAGALGQAGQQFMDTRNQSQQMQQRQLMNDLAMKGRQLQLDQTQEARARQQQMNALLQSSKNPDGTFDFTKYQQGLASLDPMAALDLQARLSTKKAPIKVGAGESLVNPDTFAPVYTAPAKPESLPSAIQEYEYAKRQGYGGTFEQWDTARKRAGATNVTTKIENKTGESLAGQVGPMMKDSRIQAQGAVRMFDAADRIEKAIASGNVSAGPMTTQIQTVKQLIQKVAGGNDEGVRQTGQAIRSLAQMAVEARKQLQGQGQVTDSEAKAVAKADSGDINDLTIGELADLVALTKRGAHYAAKSHQELLTSMGESPSTSGLAKFYGVQGVEPLLKYSPQLPQIGSGSRPSGLPSADAINAEIERRRKAAK